jgi:hypothetical protein
MQPVRDPARPQVFGHRDDRLVAGLGPGSDDAHDRPRRVHVAGGRDPADRRLERGGGKHVGARVSPGVIPAQRHRHDGERAGNDQPAAAGRGVGGPAAPSPAGELDEQPDREHAHDRHERQVVAALFEDLAPVEEHLAERQHEEDEGDEEQASPSRLGRALQEPQPAHGGSGRQRRQRQAVDGELAQGP